MLPFKTTGDARFSCEIDFNHAGIANLFFSTADHAMVPLHLSLRRGRSLIVINSDHGRGWNSEIQIAHEFPRSQASLVLEFDENGVRVLLGETLIHHASPTEFPHLGDIAFARLDGAVIKESVAIGGTANQDRKGFAELKIAPPCIITGWAFDPNQPEQQYKVQVAGHDEAFRVDSMRSRKHQAAHHDPGLKYAISAVIPGWVWRGADETDTVSIQVYSNGAACGGPLTLSRRAMAELLEAFAAQADYRSATRHTLAAIEHVRFAGLFPLLSPKARRFFSKAAAFYKVTPFLMADGGVEEEVGLPPTWSRPVVSSADFLHSRAQELFIQTMRGNPGADAGETLAHVLSVYPLQGDARIRFFLGLSEFFCVRDELLALNAQMAKTGQPLFKPGNDTWHNCAILPFLLLQGRIQDVRKLLKKFATTGGWLLTGCIAWTVRHVINGEVGNVQVDEEKRESLLWSMIALIDQQAANYWGRAHCRSFTRLAVDLMERKGSFPENVHDKIDLFLLRNYGLSREFWLGVDESVSAGKLQLGGRLRTARDLFSRIMERVEGKNIPVAEAVRFFKQWHNRDAARLGFELMGPAGVEPSADGTMSVNHLLEQGAGISEPLIRLLAFPNGSKTSPDMAESAIHAIRRGYKDIPKAPYYHLQQSSSKKVFAFIADVRDAAGRLTDGSGRLETILCDLETLGTDRSHFIGLGLLLALFNVLVDLGADDLAEIVLIKAAGMSQRLPVPKDDGMAGPPCLANALLALQYAQALKPSELRNSALYLFQNHLPKRPEPLDSEMAAGDFLSGDASFFDTLVVVMSCQPYLGTRVQELRKSWLGSLSALGIPYVIVVGGGKGELVGDVVYLDADDSYEELPQKTLRMIEWVASRTRFTYMMKIDDDCFLDAEEFFHSQSYRKFDYYGRLIARNLGDTDRVWHCGKSKTMRGRLELDKSPEPSRFADGGSGYVLSRTAMMAALSAIQTPEGEELVNGSFMEDKMLGDLLAMQGISLHDEDYYVSVLRRTHADAIPVSIWMNGFFPSKVSPVKVIHLDTDKTQQAALQIKDGHSLLPRKIWPSYAPPLLGQGTNALELVSEEAKLARLNKAPLAVIACVRNEMFMLPHFLDHYRRLGVECFLFVDNLSDDGSLEYLAGQPDVAVFSVDTEYRLSQYGVAWQQALLSSLRLARWSLVADADELLLFKGWEKGKIADRLPQWDAQGRDGVRVFMLDMYPEGPLSSVSFTSGSPFEEAGYVDRVPFLTDSPALGPYANGPTWTSALRHRLIRGSRTEQFVAQKIALMKYKPWMRLSAGLHYIGDVSLAQEEMIFAHFKYHSEFRRKAVAEVARGQHFNNAEEYRKYLAVMAEGRDMIYDPEISVHWQECGFVKSLLE